MVDTKIEWAEKSWNPYTGCSKISEGCLNCYAERMARRLAGRYGYPKESPFQVTWHPERLIEPFKWRKSRRIFVCSMGDLFHYFVTEQGQQIVMNTIFGCPHHIFMCLTKRPENAWLYFKNNPIPKNLWFGVSVENQKRADDRIPILLQIPAKVRFVSIEPMLGPVDLGQYLYPYKTLVNGKSLGSKLHWVILGGETGPGARPRHPDWPRKVRDDCQEAGVPFFFKRWGDCPYPQNTDISDWVDAGYDPYDKKAGGRLLDGRLWEQWPE